MAQTKQTQQTEQKSCLHEKLMYMRVDFLNENVKKTGFNKYSNFSYYQLDDILPVCTRIGAKYRVLMLYAIEKERAILTMINLDDLEDMMFFDMPVADAAVKGGSAIQNLGALMTYTKRYLYMDAFSIAEPDEMDTDIGREKTEVQPAEAKRKPAEQTGQKEKAAGQRPQQENPILQERITKAKVAVIRQQMKAAGVTEEQVCQACKTDCIENIKEGQFRWIMNCLEKQREKNEYAGKYENSYLQG